MVYQWESVRRFQLASLHLGATGWSLHPKVMVHLNENWTYLLSTRSVWEKPITFNLLLKKQRRVLLVPEKQWQMRGVTSIQFQFTWQIVTTKHSPGDNIVMKWHPRNFGEWWWYRKAVRWDNCRHSEEMRGNVVIWNEDLCEQWWRVMKFLTLIGENCIILNREKFQFH